MPGAKRVLFFWPENAFTEMDKGIVVKWEGPIPFRIHQIPYFVDAKLPQFEVSSVFYSGTYLLHQRDTRPRAVTGCLNWA